MKNKMNLFIIPILFFIGMFITAEVYEGGSGKQFFFTGVMLVCFILSTIGTFAINFGGCEDE